MTGLTEDEAGAMLDTTELHVLRLLAVGDLALDRDSVLAYREMLRSLDRRNAWP